jgi:sec-independent protein translocase protein TatA
MLLFLNDISGSEVLVILAFILMFFGSKSIPGIAQTMGKSIRQIKDASDELKHEIKKSGADMKKDLNLEGLIQDTVNDIQRPLDQYVEELEDAVKYEAPKQIQPVNNSTEGDSTAASPLHSSEGDPIPTSKD